jgi:hypothetical protein
VESLSEISEIFDALVLLNVNKTTSSLLYKALFLSQESLLSKANYMSENPFTLARKH